MNKLVKRYGHLMGAFALTVSTLTAEGPCTFIFYQPELPEAVKKLKKARTETPTSLYKK